MWKWSIEGLPRTKKKSKEGKMTRNIKSSVGRNTPSTFKDILFAPRFIIKWRRICVTLHVTLIFSFCCCPHYGTLNLEKITKNAVDRRKDGSEQPYCQI